jgi:hypothetical protein
MWNIMMLLDLFHLNVPNASELGKTTTVTSCGCSYFALLEIINAWTGVLDQLTA